MNSICPQRKYGRPYQWIQQGSPRKMLDVNLATNVQATVVHWSRHVGKLMMLWISNVTALELVTVLYSTVTALCDRFLSIVLENLEEALDIGRMSTLKSYVGRVCGGRAQCIYDVSWQ